MAKWRNKKRFKAPVVEQVTLDEDTLEIAKHTSLSPQPPNFDGFSQSSKLALNKRAAHLLSRADTALTASEDSSAPLYSASAGGGYGNYGVSTGSGTGNYAPGTSNYGSSVGGQSAYTAYSAGSSSGVVNGANIVHRSNNAAATSSSSTSPNRSKTPSLSNLVSKAPPLPLLPPPAKDDSDDDAYEAQRSSGRDSALEENHYEDPDTNPVHKQDTFAGASNARGTNQLKHDSDEDYLEPDTLIKSPDKPAAGRSDGLNNSQHSLHTLPPPPPIPLVPNRGTQALPAAAHYLATSPNSRATPARRVTFMRTDHCHRKMICRWTTSISTCVNSDPRRFHQRRYLQRHNAAHNVILLITAPLNLLFFHRLLLFMFNTIISNYSNL